MVVMGVGGGVVTRASLATLVFVGVLMISLPVLGGVQGDSAFSNQGMSMAGGNPQNNGLSHYNTTNVGNSTRWILSTDVLKDTGDSGYALSGFCVGPDGTIYVQKQDYLTPSERGLVAINPWGTLKWFSSATAGYGEVGQSLVVGEDGNIYCIVNTAQQFLETAPWMAWWPGLAIFSLALSFNLAGDGLRDFLDPKDY